MFYQLRVLPGGSCHGVFQLPGDKSISHRAVMLASLAKGVSDITGFLPGEDCLHTVKAMQSLGVNIVHHSPTHLTVHGVGLHGLKAAATAVDCGNAGTLMRLLTGILAGQAFESTLIGDASLSKRPMQRIVDPLAQMGAHIATAAGGVPPLNIHASRHLLPIRYALPMASAQVKSSVLLAAMFADGESQVVSAWPTRDHTERMLQYLGYPLRIEETHSSSYQNITTLQGLGALHAKPIQVPADISHAAFLLVAAAITPDAEITLTHVGVNPTRTGIIQLLQAMGADITLSDQQIISGEPTATIQLRYQPLKGIVVPKAVVPLAIDEFPIFAIAACFAEGETVLRHARELRYKESDRIMAMVNGINALGGQARALDDGMVITPQALRGGRVDALGDHRIAMSFAIAGTRASQPVWVDNAEGIATSWPDFVETVCAMGLQVTWQEQDEQHHAVQE